MRRRFLAPLIAAGIAVSAVLVAAPTSPATASAGCAGNGGAVPTGASTASIPDVDGDGKRDVEYYTEYLPGGGYDYGIRTASGRLVKLHETMPGPGDHGGWTARIVHGTVITVIDDGRSAKLFTFAGCAFHPVKNVQKQQYTFSVSGYSGPGTGVACVAQRGGLWLYGEQATRHPDETWTVTRTHVIVAAGGATAKNGVRSTVATRVQQTDRRVQDAFGSRCASITRVHNSGN